jgi:hypothetical protein
MNPIGFAKYVYSGREVNKAGKSGLAASLSGVRWRARLARITSASFGGIFTSVQVSSRFPSRQAYYALDNDSPNQ